MSGTPTGEAARRDLLGTYAAAIEAVGGRRVTAAALRVRGDLGAVAVVAIGKAAAHMLAGAFDALGTAITRALLVTRRGYAERLWRAAAPVTCIESAHPRPDASSLAAGAAVLEFLARPARGEHGLVFLVSGGASSLVEVLPAGLGGAELARMGEWLLASGLPITAMNRVRKRLSRIKGGRLAVCLEGRPTLQLMISDVPGDDPRVIGSGLLVPHTPADIAVDDLELPPWLAAHAAHPPPLAPMAAFARVETQVVARPADARDAAVREARRRGHTVHVHPALLEGQAAMVGAALAREALGGPPGVHVWNGETTVILPEHPGRGGRCQNLALAAAVELQGRDDAWLLAAGTDGSDGPGEDAGALVDGGTVARGRRAGHEPASSLAAADAGSFLADSGDLVNTGPTGTNVMDLVLALKRG